MLDSANTHHPLWRVIINPPFSCLCRIRSCPRSCLQGRRSMFLDPANLIYHSSCYLVHPALPGENISQRYWGASSL